MKLVNLTQHDLTMEQMANNTVMKVDRNKVSELLTFTKLPDVDDINYKAYYLAHLAKESGATHALIGGAPYLMSELERALKRVKIVPVYSFSERVSQERLGTNGSVVKTNVFKHIGFIEV